MTSPYTASGARRIGDNYQDIQSAKLLVDWLEHPEKYHRVRLEAMDGSLDDIQAELHDGSRQLWQIKHGVDNTNAWTWDDFTFQKQGVAKLLPSLLQKWQTSLNDVKSKNIVINEVALLTNRTASADISNHLSEKGLIDFKNLHDSLKTKLSSQLGDSRKAASFFKSFHFYFAELSLPALEDSLLRRFRQLGGTSDGWNSLMKAIQRWINHQNEPNFGGFITLANVRTAALWHVPAPIPQGFSVPDDYVPPQDWGDQHVRPQLQTGGSLVVVTDSPGAGKSTYLSWLVDKLRQENRPVIRHHYFLSTTDETRDRTKSEIAANALIAELLGSYSELILGIDSQNPTPDRLPEFLKAAGNHCGDDAPLVVIVDGLDHVWREMSSAEELRKFFELLLPVPKGVVILVGTQDIDLTKIPSKLRDLCPHQQWLKVPNLDKNDVRQWLEHHREKFLLPQEVEQADEIFFDLVSAFHKVSAGHPLILHYTLNKVWQNNPEVRAEHVLQLPCFDATSSVASYYRGIWESINPQGHKLLHLLAGFPWAWTRDGLVECLTPQADFAQLEQAEQAIHHVLGDSPAGVTAFHESLLAFVRASPDHQTAVNTLRPLVLSWLCEKAPDYWRWRYEWEERARSRDTAPLIESATLDWCVDSLVAGRELVEIGEIVAASGWAALKEQKLGIATQRHYLDVYLENARHAESVFLHLKSLAFHRLNTTQLERELNLFLAHKSWASPEEIAAIAEIAFLHRHHAICRKLLRECGDRRDAEVEKQNRQNRRGEFSSLEQYMPFIIAASLELPLSDEPYQRYFAQHNEAPNWCRTDIYAKALARLCTIGTNTAAQREELRFLANQSNDSALIAVDEVVRLACRDVFSPTRWISNEKSQQSGLFRCYQLWCNDDTQKTFEPLDTLSFQSVGQFENQTFAREQSFEELTRIYFFACLANIAQGHKPTRAVDISSKSEKVTEFLSLIKELAIEAVAFKAKHQTLGAAWLIERLVTIEPPDINPKDWHDNNLIRRGLIAKSVLAIAQDLEELHIAKFPQTSLNAAIIKKAVESKWTAASAWINDCVERQLIMHDPKAAQFLIVQEKNWLAQNYATLHERAEAYVLLAQFCRLHGDTAQAQEFFRLAARNLLGHGYHKDDMLDKILEAIRFVHEIMPSTRSLSYLQALSPVIQVIGDITDGDGTGHLKGELAETVWEIVPEALPSYLRRLQHQHHHWDVESCFTYLAKVISLTTPYEKALVTTLVHEDALAALQKRANNGDLAVASLLKNMLAYYGRQEIAEPPPDNTYTPDIDKDKTPPNVANYPPERLNDFIAALRDAHIYGNEHVSEWTRYWLEQQPAQLLEALTQYRDAHHGDMLETKTAQAVVRLATEYGREAWDWLVASHKSLYGWSRYSYKFRELEWIWQELCRSHLKNHFKNHWLRFIIETSRARWQTVAEAPSWGVVRMVQFLHTISESQRIEEVLDVAVQWGANSAADMILPDSSLSLEQSELPIALRLLVDRLDCPSRKVQERAAWSLAELLSQNETRDATISALLNWHAIETLEMRSCLLLLIFHLAHVAQGLSLSICLKAIQQANIVPSIGADLLLCEFGNDGVIFANTLNYQTCHSDYPSTEFSRIENFERTVKAHLAPLFWNWVNQLERRRIPFSRQWQWETLELARKHDMLAQLNLSYFDHHYTGDSSTASLAVNDRLSMLLRSAYLRALHWTIDKALLDREWVETEARHVAFMADTLSWRVRPIIRPIWWPADTNTTSELDLLAHAIGQAVNHRLQTDCNNAEILAFAAGALGNRANLCAEVTIRAFLQSAHGAIKPSQNKLANEIPRVLCGSMRPQSFLSGIYVPYTDQYTDFVSDWFVAPLAWRFHPQVENWLLPEQQTRGLYLPATWLFPNDEPRICPETNQIAVTLNNQQVAHYHYWHDELRERFWYDTGSRLGCELFIQREWLAPHLAAGANLCWLVKLHVAQRGKYKKEFDEPKVMTWLVGGSHIMRTKPWQI